MSLPKTLGRALAVAGSGSGLTSYALGQTVGENNHTLTLTETPAGITSANASQAITINFGYNVAATPNSIGPVNFATAAANHAPSSIGGWFGLTGATTSNSIGVTSNNTGGAAHNTMQPTSFLNAMVKQ
jgi:microcystin-dependent protein